MPRIRIVTDSACDIPDALLRQYNVTVVPHSVSWDGGDSASTAGQLVKHLRSEGFVTPQVSAPSVEEFTRVYRSLRDGCDGVLSIHASSKLSEAFANASSAREAFGPIGQGGPFPVAVVDSLSMSMGLGWIVLAMARAAQPGLDLSAMVSRAKRLVEQTHVAFFTDSLEGLRKIGSLDRLGSQWEGLSSIKPLFHLDEGQVVVYERTRTRPKARDALYNFVEDFPKIGEIAVFHTGAQLDLEHLMTRIGAIYPRERVLILPAGPVVSAWLGPDALGVAVLEGET